MDNSLNFLVPSAVSSLFSAFCIRFLIVNRYNLAIYNRGQYLLFQEIIVTTINTQISFCIGYATSEIDLRVLSYGFIVSHSAFFISYFLFMYRLITLNKIEFGKFQSLEYPKIYNRLTPIWNIKVTIITAFIISSPMIILFYFSRKHSVLQLINLQSSDRQEQVFAIYYFTVAFCEFFFYISTCAYVLFGKFRLTVKIEIFTNVLLWIFYFSCRFQMSGKISFIFLIPLRNFCILFLLIVSLTKRMHATKVPFPPLFGMSSMFLYENKIFYEQFYNFLENTHGEEFLKYLELGLYVNMYKFQGKQKYLKLIKSMCRDLEIEFNKENFDEVLVEVTKKNESIFQAFEESGYYANLLIRLESYKGFVYF